MLFTELKIMRGPNMWSDVYQQLLVVRFDLNYLNNLSEKPTIFPTQNENENWGTNLCSYFAELTANLQGDNLFYNLQYPAAGICCAIISYQVEEAGKEAVETANAMIEKKLRKEEELIFKDEKERILHVARTKGDGPTTALIINEAKKRNIPILRGPAGYTLFGYGKNQKKISAAMSYRTSSIGVNIAGNKEHTKQFLANLYLPVPKGKIVRSEAELLEVGKTLGYPLVTKPINGNQGRNITCNIQDHEALLNGFLYAKEISKAVIVEKEIKGHDYRLLVIGNKFVAASLRLPALVTGDGQRTIAELVEAENKNPQRGYGHENILTKIKIDFSSEICLQKQGYTTHSILEKNKTIHLKNTANLSTGGTAEDVTDLVHSGNKELAEKVSKIIGLDICGIDIISEDISVPLEFNNGAIIEVNAAPGLRMHQYPSKGIPREIGQPIIDLYFDKEDEGRIPIIAITGTNGKTTTTRLMAHVAKFAGKAVGFTCTDGIFIKGEKLVGGDCSGPQSAKTVLQDPDVDFAVLECARGGIIRTGLAFDKCDIGIVTNVAEDHLGLKDINTLEDLAKVKSVVPCSVKENGWAILNAEDKYAAAMRYKVTCNVALFSSDFKNENLQSHIKSGGTAAFVTEEKDIFIVTGDDFLFVVNAREIPITKQGKAGFMIENILPVVLASYFSGFDMTQTANALVSFIPSAEQSPGRINDFKINGVNVIVDYAHNPHGMRALAAYLKNIPQKKLGIITGTGDRRDEDIIEFGRIAAGIYDDIIIRFDRDTRGRSKESIIELLHKGIQEIKPGFAYQIIPDTKTAIEVAVANSEKNSYVVICADNATYTVGLTKEVAEQYHQII